MMSAVWGAWVPSALWTGRLLLTVYGSHFFKLKGDCLCAACSMHALTFLHDILCNSYAYVSILTLTCVCKKLSFCIVFFLFLQWFEKFFLLNLCIIFRSSSSEMFWMAVSEFLNISYTTIQKFEVNIFLNVFQEVSVILTQAAFT